MITRLAIVSTLIMAVALAACTVHQSDSAPPLTGPSDFAQSITITSNPDRLTQDGQSQSALTIKVFDAAGSAAVGVPIRLDMLVGGTLVDFGTLSARNLVTGSDGRATAVYTAAPAPPPASQVSNTVTIRAIAVGTNAQSSNSFSTDIRLVPPGVILPPAGTPTASFTSSPSPASSNVPLIFDASSSLPGTNAVIVSYQWTFGDGSSASGRTVSKTFTTPGTFSVTLTVANDRGIAASTTQAITVGTTTAPTAAFTFSPTAPAVNQGVNFNAAASNAAPGRSIASYSWNFGDGSATKSGVTAQHDYGVAGTYSVTLTVTDDVGQRSTAAQSVTVANGNGGGGPAAPTPAFTFSPASPGVGETVFFNAGTSTAGAGRSIVSYSWTFGDGATATGASPTTTHPYATAGTYSVQLMVTDNGVPALSSTSTPTAVTVGNPPAPTALFTFSPTNPVVDQLVVFDAATSTTGQGQTILKYEWNFGDLTPIITCPGSPSCGPSNRTISHTFPTAQIYTVNLVVTDTATRTGATQNTVTVSTANPTARLTLTKAGGTSIIADGSATTATGTSTIVSYTFNWGDLSGSTSGSSSSASHTFPTPVAPATTGTFTVVLTATDNAGRSATTSQTITVP